MDPLELETLYGKYGFQPVETGIENVLAFALRTGYFLNADVIALTLEAEVIAAKAILEQTGYACTVRHYADLSEAELELFTGFFTADSSRVRLKQDYKRFARAVSTSWGGAEYHYVSGPFTSDNSKNENNESVIDHVCNLLKGDEPALVILEAAAGYGKTCTAYEVLLQLLNSTEKHVPILTELSLNRQAKIFRYVLLDEINRSLPGLRYELVQEQIQRGRVPLIIDGFDELLSRRANADDAFEEAEPMLETIAEILKGSAKVLLTTRRTAIFTQQEFEAWRTSKLGNINVCRVRLEKPTLHDWLGDERVAHLEGSAVPISELANPVLLAFLLNLSDKNFYDLCQKPGDIVNRYFEALLEREITRQALTLSVSEQLNIFRSLAADMLRETFTTEPREFVQLRIIDQHKHILELARAKYAREERPTLDELADKLASHALLDRRNNSDEQIGFVNDFVLGTLIGDNICEDPKKLEETKDLELFMDVAATAYIAQPNERRFELWLKTESVVDLFDINSQLRIDLALRASFQRHLQHAAITDLDVKNAVVGDEYNIEDTSFIGCSFSDVIIVLDNFTNVSFISCSFKNCTLNGVPRGTLNVFGCQGDDSHSDLLRIQSENFEGELEQEPFIEELEEFERDVLSNFWLPGSLRASIYRKVESLYRGNAKSDYPDVTKAIESLQRKGLIDFDRDLARLNQSRLNEIATLLGRQI